MRAPPAAPWLGVGLANPNPNSNPNQVLSAFVSGFKHHAADPAGRALATAAVERLEKVSLVRQQLQRQILSIVSSYDTRSASSSSWSSSTAEVRVRITVRVS